MEDKQTDGIALPRAPIFPKKNGEDTRQCLMNSAKHLFAAKGYEGTTVKNIADRAGVNISLVSYYFGGKEGIYQSCLEQLGTANLIAAQRILKEPKSLEEFRVRLGLFIEQNFDWYVQEPELTSIVLRECELASPMVLPLFERTFLQVFFYLQSFLKAAKQRGYLHEGLDVEVTASLIFGSISHFARVKRLHKQLMNLTIRDPIYRKKVTDTLLQVILTGILWESPKDI